MRTLTLALLASCLLLAGCGSMLASLQVDTIEDDPGYRTFGRIIEDDHVETKAIVNIHAADELYHEAQTPTPTRRGRHTRRPPRHGSADSWTSDNRAAVKTKFRSAKQSNATGARGHAPIRALPRQQPC